MAASGKQARHCSDPEKECGVFGNIHLSSIIFNIVYSTVLTGKYTFYFSFIGLSLLAWVDSWF